MPVEKRGRSWRAQVCIEGKRYSATHRTKGAALAWIRERKLQIESGILTPATGTTFGELLKRYQNSVTPRKRGSRWESVRIDSFRRQPIAAIRLADLCTPHFVEWRDARLEEVSASTVRRELTILGHVCKVGWKEYRWLDHNPVSDVSRPEAVPHRERLLAGHEIDKLLAALGYVRGTPATTLSQQVALCLLFALETAMRSGEILGLTRASIVGRTARLAKTKNGKAREVPLTKEALAILDLLPTDDLFTVTDASRDALFRKARKAARLKGMVFHDTRHTAITRLAKKVPVLALARMTGHSDIKQLMTYYNETAEEIAELLDS